MEGGVVEMEELGESLEFRVKFADRSSITRRGTIAKVKEEVGERDVENVVVWIVSATDDVLAVGSAGSDEFSSFSYMVARALERAERIKTTQFTMAFPRWEPSATAAVD